MKKLADIKRETKIAKLRLKNKRAKSTAPRAAGKAKKKGGKSLKGLKLFTKKHDQECK